MKKLKKILSFIFCAAVLILFGYFIVVLGIRLYNIDKFLSSTGRIPGKCTIKCNNAYRIDFDRPECICADGKVYMWDEL